MTLALFQTWAERFGLATAPFFRADRGSDGIHHTVLLDGGFGSFALSEAEADIWRKAPIADWAWSSNLPHHVTVTDQVVAVRRWDKREPELLSRKSVDARLESFYEYLASDRVRSNQSVVEHVLSIFRRVRSLVAEAGLPDEQSIDVFLGLLSRAIAREEINGVEGLPAGVVLFPESQDLIRRLSRSGTETLLNDAFVGNSSFRMFPSLAVRHAGSEIFQESHFALLRASDTDLFGYTAPALSRPVTRGGAHFTPAPLARSVVEQTFAQFDVAQRRRLVVTDPACGSGAFLHEAMRTLRRLGFEGELILAGRDISPAAISMAGFVVRHAASEWMPAGGLQVDLQVADTLTSPLPRSDAILMNPPFISWSALSAEQRNLMRTILGSRLQGRGDLSMAFITRAVEALSPGGVCGVLFPSSLLTLQAAESWRSDLLEIAEMRLLASLGDYGLFMHALVQVAAAVFVRRETSEEQPHATLAVVSNNTPEATGNALRMLRRWQKDRQELDVDQGDCRLFELPSERFQQRPTWRITPPGVDRALARLNEEGMPQIADLFEVKQGIRTGNNAVFLIDGGRLKSLPARERQYFRPAVVSDSIQDGRPWDGSWVFYPYREGKLVIESEADLQKKVPRFAEQTLFPNKTSLKSRTNITRAHRSDWWGLSEPRATWAMRTEPRLVSKYFGGLGGFALDLDAKYVVIQGYAWLLKHRELLVEEVASDLDDRDVLRAYVALMNSRPFGKVLALFSSHVAGGQFDLSPRYVNAMPIPDLRELARNERSGRKITRLARLGSDVHIDKPEWSREVDLLAIELYGRDFVSLL